MTIPGSMVEQLNSDLRGQPVWGLARGIGSYLDVEIGPARQLADETTVGAWHLWVYMADWRIEQEGRILVGSNDMPDLIDEVVAGIGSSTFESVAVQSQTGDAMFGFGEGVRLVVFATALPTDDSEAWILTQPDGSTLSGGPGTRWALEGAS